LLDITRRATAEQKDIVIFPASFNFFSVLNINIVTREDKLGYIGLEFKNITFGMCEVMPDSLLIQNTHY
jgi:hypothetical protein